MKMLVSSNGGSFARICRLKVHCLEAQIQASYLVGKGANRDEIHATIGIFPDVI